jgi:hypothetical protein
MCVTLLGCVMIWANPGRSGPGSGPVQSGSSVMTKLGKAGKARSNQQDTRAGAIVHEGRF